MLKFSKYRLKGHSQCQNQGLKVKMFGTDGKVCHKEYTC